MVPHFLTCLRAALGPLLIALAYIWPNRAAFATCVVAAFVSDIFDGVMARKIGVATPGLRRLDSLADSIFYLCALWTVWLLHPTVISENLAMLAVLLVLECSRYAFDVWKFRREASYHMWSSKLWGIALFMAFYSVLVLDHGGVIVAAAIALGILADLEGLLISFALPSWHHDVPTIIHAMKIRAKEHAI
jgi:phosphatidylglycerophosphate synthase